VQTLKPIKFRAWLVGTIFTSYTFCIAGAAFAQTGAPAATPTATEGLSTITVVARKKREDLQKVPLSVSAISAKTLKQAHVENLHDIAALTPGVNVAEIGAEVGTAITIRGVTDLTFGAGVPAVATFLDFTYLRDPAAINVAAIPLQQVEVLKGPVSALYGKDAYAGVINYIAARPTTTPHANISETAGDYGKSELQGDISGPIYGDKVLGEVFGDFDTFNGTFHDKVSGANAGGDQKKDIGGLLDFNWSDNVSTHLDFYYGYDYFNAAPTEALMPNCGPAFQPAVVGGVGTFVDSDSLYCGRIKTNGSVETGNDPAAGNPGNERRTFYGSMRNTLAYDWGNIDSITGASQIDEQAFQQFDPTSLGLPFLLASSAPLPPTFNPANNPPDGNYIIKHGYYGGASNTGEVSEELRYTSPQSQPLRYGAGGFFDSESRIEYTGASISDAGIPPGQELYSAFGQFFPISLFETPNGSVTNYNKDIHVSDEEAAFANAEYDLLPNLTASAEYRYTWSLQLFTPISLDAVPGVTYPDAGVEPNAGHIKQANQYFSTNEALRWFPVSNEMLYFAFANGVKPGGFNGASSVVSDESFGPETDTNYEGGIKSSFLDNALQLNAAVYHIDTQNVQAYGPGSDPTNPATVIKNYGATSNTGFEVDVRSRPLDSLVLTGGLSYTDPTFNPGSYDLSDTSYCALIGPSCTSTEVLHKGLRQIPIAGNSVPYVSKYTLSATAEYDYILLNQYPAYFRLDYSYRSSEYTDAAQFTSIGPASDLDFFAGVTKGRYSLSAYVKNITNDTTPVDAPYEVQLSAFQNVPVGILSQGRTFAFTVAASF
jgi:iron complex outermembrane receptor protein